VVSTLHKQSSMSNAPQGAVAHVASSVAVRIVAGTHVVGTWACKEPGPKNLWLGQL
jgi:hypothetical protein